MGNYIIDRSYYLKQNNVEKLFTRATKLIFYKLSLRLFKIETKEFFSDKTSVITQFVNQIYPVQSFANVNIDTRNQGKID